MKVLVTGASGFIGSRVARRLGDGGHAVRCLLRATSRPDRLAGVPFERCAGDVRDAAAVSAAAAGCDAIVHLACLSSWTDLRKHQDQLDAIAVGGTKNVLDAARAHGVKRVVYVSSVAALNASDAPVVFDESSRYELESSGLAYSIAKHRAERLVAAESRDGLETVTVMPAEVYGPEDEALVTAGNLVEILKSWPPVACRGGTSVAHVDDVAHGIVSALERGRAGERYVLGGDNLAVSDLVALTLRLAGKPARVWVLPNGLVRVLCRALAAVGLPAPVPLDVLEYATRYWFASSDKARRELGYAPRSAEETLRPVVLWLLANAARFGIAPAAAVSA